jgi:DNA modification methylase
LKPYYQNERVAVYNADVLDALRAMPDESVHCCVTSPPYWGLRDYGHEGQIGLEKTPQEFVAKMVEVFRDVRRVLKKDGVCWVNLGDSYAAGAKGSGGTLSKQPTNAGSFYSATFDLPSCGLKPKDLCGIPWRVAFALQDDGWYLRQDIVWNKPNPMPESVMDRCTKAHEYIFLLSKSERYYYDQAAVAERAIQPTGEPLFVAQHKQAALGANQTGTLGTNQGKETRNRRSVWEIATQPYAEAHFATFPEELPKVCILAGCPEGGTVLDPFLGSGTTLAVATRLGRRGVGIELNPKYAQLAVKRITAETPSFDFEVAA